MLATVTDEGEAKHYYRHTKNVHKSVMIHPDRVRKVKYQHTGEDICLVAINTPLMTMMTSKSYMIGGPLPTPEEPKYRDLRLRVEEMSFDEAYMLKSTPMIGPFAKQMELFKAPMGTMYQGRNHAPSEEVTDVYLYSGERKKSNVTIHASRVKIVSEGLEDFYLVLAEAKLGDDVEMSVKTPSTTTLVEEPSPLEIRGAPKIVAQVAQPSLLSQGELKVIDKTSYHNLLYGDSLDGLTNPPIDKYHDLVQMPKERRTLETWGTKPAYCYRSQNNHITYIHPSRVRTINEETYAIATDFKFLDLPEQIKKNWRVYEAEFRHRDWLTLDNLRNGTDNKTIIGDMKKERHGVKYSFDQDESEYKLYAFEIENQEYCVVKRPNGTILYLPSTRWEYDEQTKKYTINADLSTEVPLKTWQIFFKEKYPEIFKKPLPKGAYWE